MPLSLCIPTYNRYELTVKSFAGVVNDKRISEIVINDDHSTDGSYERLRDHFGKNNNRIKIYQNKTNLGVYGNKQRCAERARKEFMIILDSDNVISKTYLDKIWPFQPWMSEAILAPDYAMPHFDYRSFSGITLTKENVHEYADKPMFDCLINTMNYFVHRRAYLRVYDPNAKPLGADSMFMNYQWLLSGGSIYIVPGLQYHHLVHKGSNFQKQAKESEPIVKQVMELIRNLR